MLQKLEILFKVIGIV